MPGVPFKRLLLIALATSPFFGLVGALPGFTMFDFNMQRTVIIFISITCTTLIFWLINLGLIRPGKQFPWLRHNVFRFLLSTLLCSAVVYVSFHVMEPFHKNDQPRMMQPKYNPQYDSQKGNWPQHHQRHDPGRMILRPIVQALSINLIIFILIELMILRATKSKVDSENEQLKLANLEAKNNQLKQQLHPHFLFNSLSTLRSLISRSPEKAEDYLEKLSDLLRFSTNNSHQSVVWLHEEVTLCTNYLNMQKVRFGEALNFTIDVPGHLLQTTKVPVYALQQLAENAIKHNILTIEEPLNILVKANEQQQLLVIENNLQPKPTADHSGGVGLANLSERYRLLGNHAIEITTVNLIFSVSIKLL